VALGYAFTTQPVERMISCIDPENEASQAVAERIGETKERDVCCAPAARTSRSTSGPSRAANGSGGGTPLDRRSANGLLGRMTDAPPTVYRDRDFQVFAAVRFIVTIAMQVQSVAIGWQIYD